MTLGLATGLIALVWTGVLARMHLEGQASALDRIEAPLLDLRFQIAGHRGPPRDLAIVAIDDEAVRQAGRYPLPRTAMARLVDEVARHGPKAVGLDILFLDHGPPEADAALAESLGAARAVVAAAGLFPRTASTLPGGDIPRPEQVLWPVEAVRQAAAVGLVNISTDHAGTPRHVPLVLGAEDTLLPSFPLRVATLALGADPGLAGDRLTLGGAVTRTDLGLHLPLRFYGPRGTIPTFSARAVLDGTVPAEHLRGRIVVVGVTAVGTGDTFATPFDPVLPGVEVIATAIGHLTAGDGLVRDGRVRRTDAAAAFALALGTVLALTLAPLGAALLLVGAGAAGWLLVTVAAFEANLWLSAAMPLAAMALPAALGTLARQGLDRHQTRRLVAAEAALRRFQPPVLAERIASDPAYLAEPRAQKAAIVFIDLSRFTLLSERLGPARTRELLRAFHALVEEEVTRQDGVVLSFMGDGAMIAFGLPDARPDDARRALHACAALVTGATKWIGALAQDLGADLDVRVGAHYGPVVVSRLGADTHQHITATGDSVNVTSRLLDVAAREGAAFVASADLLAAAGEDPARFGFRDLKTVAIRGRRESLSIALWAPA
ncbi:MAG TPA: adenylate/guanylate cyclase domain-containing protein [Microvirga sp.]|nr:adenylate/guanylate cyclase domain-containing protein [Microvirga sp.]